MSAGPPTESERNAAVILAYILHGVGLGTMVAGACVQQWFGGGEGGEWGGCSACLGPLELLGCRQ